MNNCNIACQIIKTLTDFLTLLALLIGAVTSVVIAGKTLLKQFHKRKNSRRRMHPGVKLKGCKPNARKRPNT